MRSSALWILLMLASCPAWAARDPFAPPQARCQLHQADLWREKGRVGAGAVTDAGENVASRQPRRDAPDRLAAYRC